MEFSSCRFWIFENAVINMTDKIDKTTLRILYLICMRRFKIQQKKIQNISKFNQKMIFDEVKIPLKDKNSNNLSPLLKFALDNFKY